MQISLTISTESKSDKKEEDDDTTTKEGNFLKKFFWIIIDYTFRQLCRTHMMQNYCGLKCKVELL